MTRTEINQAANRAEDQLTRMPEKDHNNYLKTLESPVLMRMYCQFAKFAGIFAAGHKIKEKCWEILTDRKAV